mmetsp:Transcript_19732/g.42011  ORF Transcript_19732/g.42011 Transcript_19732/m.42011 type:complete len:200 (+) Transcript_19732:978-1577(+)
MVQHPRNCVAKPLLTIMQGDIGRHLNQGCFFGSEYVFIQQLLGNERGHNIDIGLLFRLTLAKANRYAGQVREICVQHELRIEIRGYPRSLECVCFHGLVGNALERDLCTEHGCFWPKKYARVCKVNLIPAHFECHLRMLRWHQDAWALLAELRFRSACIDFYVVIAKPMKHLSARRVRVRRVLKFFITCNSHARGKGDK